MLRATSPVRDFSGLQRAVLCLASLPNGFVSDRRLASIVLRRDRSAPALTARPSAVEPSGFPGTRRSIPRRGPPLRGERRTTGRLNRGPAATAARIAHRPAACIECLGAVEAQPLCSCPVAKNRPRPRHRRTTDAARVTSTRCTPSLLSGRGPARPAPLDPSQVTDFSHGYAKL